MPKYDEFDLDVQNIKTKPTNVTVGPSRYENTSCDSCTCSTGTILKTYCC